MNFWDNPFEDDISRIPLINKLFAKDKTKCINNKSGLYSCINVNCDNKNPFLCQIKNCQCSKEHEGCHYVMIEKLVKRIELIVSPTSVLENRISIQFNNLIAHITGVRDQIIKQIKNGEANNLFNLSDADILNESKHLSGKLFSEFVDVKKSVNGEKLSKVMKDVQSNFNHFKIIDLSFFTTKISKELTVNVNKTTSWNKQLIGQGLTVEGRVVKCVESIDKQHLALLSTPINQMMGDLVQWRIKIVQITQLNSIMLGIGLKNILKHNKFTFSSFNSNNHGCYLMGSNGFAYTYKHKQLNFCKMQGFNCTKGDIVRIKLDKKTWMIKFTNQTTTNWAKLKIWHQPSSSPQEDQYHICVGLRNKGDQVELLGKIHNDGVLYTII